MVKRFLACEFNLKELRKNCRRLYMWTLTFPHFTTTRDARDMVRVMMQWFNRHGCSGVRVYEKHRNGSLHIHVVLDRFLNVRIVRHCWQNFGGGRIHVKFLNPDDAGLYVTKELMKARQKTGFDKGTRVYASFGKLWEEIGKSKVSSIRFESDSFLNFLWTKGENYTAVRTFSFGLEFFGVGYATEAELTASRKQRKVKWSYGEFSNDGTGSGAQTESLWAAM